MSTGDEPCAVGYELQSADRSDTSFVPISAQMALSGENFVLSAEATAVVTDQGPIEPDRLRSLGSYALVVDNAIASTGP